MTLPSSKSIQAFFGKSSDTNRGPIHAFDEADSLKKRHQLANGNESSHNIIAEDSHPLQQQSAGDRDDSVPVSQSSPKSKLATGSTPSPHSSISSETTPARRSKRQKVGNEEATRTGENRNEEQRLRHEGSPGARFERALESNMFVAASDQEHAQNNDSLNRRETKEEKVLRISSNGTLSSPKREKKARDDACDAPNVPHIKTRGRRKKRSSLLVIIPYGLASLDRRRSIAQSIDRIRQEPIASCRTQPPLTTSTQAVNPRKPTHPFFGGQPTVAPKTNRVKQTATRDLQTEASDSTKVKAFTTPVKFRQAENIRPGAQTPPLIPSGAFPGRRTTLSGLYEPWWPWKGLTRVNQPSTNVRVLGGDRHLDGGFDNRRKKHKPETVKRCDDVLSPWRELVRNTGRGATGKRDIKRPHRTIESTPVRQARALAVNSASQPATNSISRNDAISQHSALRALQKRIGRQLSPFDGGACETRSWHQKYAPQTSAQVLQAQHEVLFLRDWLAQSTVESVEGIKPTATEPRVPDSLATRSGTTLKKRRKRRAEELDGFVVSSDEDVDFQDMIPEAQSRQSSLPAGNVPKSMVRKCGGLITTNARKANAMLLSGPCGCGKTAAVHAVAQELNFDLFEINAASRRSGKDLLDRVGDLALNHQVSRREIGVLDAGPEPIDDEDSNEQQQSGLTTFFNTTSKPSRGRPPKKATTSTAALDKAEQRTRMPQKQALILLEEVDLLFEDDKAFWETVLGLAQQSRRPIIMTCNNESLLPMESLPLQAVLRFGCVPSELATPYLLLLAAAENHHLDPEAVSRLYETKGLDLRATIGELQFRCQMGLGDEKGGLSWYLRRWPPRSNFDADGNLLHVISNQSFESGSDLLSWGLGGISALHEDLVLQTTREHDVELTSVAQAALSSPAVSTVNNETTLTPSNNVAHLAEFSTSLDHLSSLDILGRVDAHHENHDILDPTAPQLSDVTRANYTIGLPLLHASQHQDYHALSSRIRAYFSLGIARYFQTQERFLNPRLSDNVTDTATLKSSLLSFILERKQNLPAHLHKDTMISYKSALLPLSDLPDPSTNPTPAETTDIAPYARSIAAYDDALASHRAALLEAYDEPTGDGRAAKKARRTTRASRSALEGGKRVSTRRERWFGKEVDYEGLMGTAGDGWPRMEAEALAAARMAQGDEASARSSLGPAEVGNGGREGSVMTL